MTHRPVISYELAVRGRELAERRLNYLTELYDSGRWIRFHSEAELLLNVREAKAAVAVWRSLEAIRPVKPPERSISPNLAISAGHSETHKIELINLALERLVPQQIPAGNAGSIAQDSLDVLSNPSSLLPPILFAADEGITKYDLGNA